MLGNSNAFDQTSTLCFAQVALKSLSKLAEAPAEAEGDPFLNEEACNNEAISQAKNVVIAFFSVGNNFLEEILDRFRDAIKVVEYVLQDFFGESDA